MFALELLCDKKFKLKFMIPRGIYTAYFYAVFTDSDVAFSRCYRAATTSGEHIGGLHTTQHSAN